MSLRGPVGFSMILFPLTEDFELQKHRSAAVTCAVLGPAGPQRSRILANLYRDDRTTTHLPPFKTTILRKMFLDHILRPSEIKEFASGLEVHQMAQLAVDNRIKVDDDMDLDDKGDLKGRKGAENVLDKAVMEHNIQACAKVRTKLFQSF